LIVFKRQFFISLEGYDSLDFDIANAVAIVVGLCLQSSFRYYNIDAKGTIDLVIGSVERERESTPLEPNDRLHRYFS